MADAAEMPRYRCHKEVWALQIAKATLIGYPELTEIRLEFIDKGYAPMNLPISMTANYTPTVGDYLVVYQDGYKSFSPKKAFEEGYNLIEKD